jgi:hypothetical protein
MKLYDSLITIETPILMLEHFKTLGDLHIDVFAVSITLTRSTYRTAWIKDPGSKKVFSEELMKWAMP